MTWPIEVPVLYNTENMHLYSTHPHSLPGLWGMFRKIYPGHVREAISALGIALHYTHTDLITQSINDYCHQGMTRTLFLFNLVSALLEYTDGQEPITLVVLDHIHAQQENSSTSRQHN